jgi:hypothetical protein
LIIYPVEEAKEKAKKAWAIFRNSSPSMEKAPPKNGGAKIKRFFIH